ncbi:MAG: DUF2752 domain-containing protein [Actinomycetales bacterium]|uniref:DUF2752 domain-containing protein n=1 Tax=Candidatus Phosphoribacter hodrii TaxID=2953743 RepID=A0A9D7XW40_9MICO|nr:DUF2752 domain-containing protein [Candidatus Phosphoribacter hodrii]
MNGRRDLNNLTLLWAGAIPFALINIFVSRRFDLQCPFLATTGYRCPLCGGTHALDFARGGQFLDSLHANALVVLYFLVGVGLVFLRVPAVARIARTSRWHSSHLAPSLVTFLLAWTVLRNLTGL